MTVRQILDDAGKESDVSLSIKQLTLYSYKKEHKIHLSLVQGQGLPQPGHLPLLLLLLLNDLRPLPGDVLHGVDLSVNVAPEVLPASLQLCGLLLEAAGLVDPPLSLLQQGPVRLSKAPVARPSAQCS